MVWRFCHENPFAQPDFLSGCGFYCSALSELATGLAERGHEVSVVTGRRAYDSPDCQFATYEEWRGIKIYRVFSTRFGKGAKWHRAVDFASFILSSCLRLLVLPRQDLVWP